MRNAKFFLAAAAALAGSPAFAAGDNMVINANVANACSFYANDVTVDMSNIRTGVTQTGAVQIWCTNGYAVQISAASANSYNLVSGPNSIAYQFRNGGGAVWSNEPFTGTGSPTATNVPFSLTFPAQNPAAGAYTDTITFTVAP